MTGTAALPDRYADPRVVGRGGMGEIYLAEDRELGRKVAIKLLNEHFAGSEESRQRFKREALTAAKLSGDPHVVTIFDVGEWNGRPFIVMEYLAGGTLGDRARGGRVDHAQAVDWLGQTARALDAAHAQGIVHRDVKPANLLFNERGELQVADFGIARAVDDTSGMTAAGTVLGTAGYLAPEQARGEPATAASDRYALGVVGYELLTGGRPFERASATAEAVAHISEPVPPASQRGDNLPRSIDPVLERALAKDPQARYESGAAFVSALSEALRGQATAPTRAIAVPPPPRTRMRSHSPERRRPWALPLLFAALATAAIVGILAAFLAAGDGDRPSQATTPGPVTATVQETIGTTVVTTVVTTTPPPPATPGPVTVEEAVALTDEAARLLEDERWADALKTQRRALGALEDTYTDDFRYEAYAYYNMGKALAELGRCNQALDYLDRSEELQGQREEIDEARALCEEGD
ncbi:MAG: serine/threonine-protein kinase [Gaiellaceae bacterium]